VEEMAASGAGRSIQSRALIMPMYRRFLS